MTLLATLSLAMNRQGILVLVLPAFHPFNLNFNLTNEESVIAMYITLSNGDSTFDIK